MDKRGNDKNAERSNVIHYVAKKNTLLNRISGSCDVNISKLRAGMLVEAVEVLRDGGLRIRVTDPAGADVWKNTEWLCHRYDLVPVSSIMWQYLAAVSSPQERVKLATDKQLCKELNDIKLKSKVLLQNDPAPTSGEQISAVIQYIGPVPELGYGLYFGLEILGNRQSFQHVELTQKYFTTSAQGIGIFVDLSNIRPCKTDLLDFGEPERRNIDIVDNVTSVCNVPVNNESQNVGHTDKLGELHIGSHVEIQLGSSRNYGFIRWIGALPGIPPEKLIAGVELEDEHPQGTDGICNNVRYFHCKPHRALFVDINQCQSHNRIDDGEPKKMEFDKFGNTGNSVVAGMVRPISVKGDLETICGKYRGIQGHHNSCYLDATLFSMFTFTNVFDSLLFRPPNEKDCAQYEEVQRVLREEIVNPLRKNLFVRADRVMKLRTLLEKLSSISGLTSEEKDPEEFLTSLVAQILNAEPFLKLSSGQDAYHYQLFVEKDDHLNLPTVQQLLEQSFLTSDIRLKEVPSCLIIQMPRFGKSFKMYQKIQPSQLLDVTDIIEDSPRQCTVCGKLAEFECKECYGQCGVGLESIAFCVKCLEKVHSHEKRKSHKAKKLTVPIEFAILQEHCPVPRLYMELSAVVCIETSHYVSFVKCGSGSDAPWCFFDSMADRKGEQNGYNIPEMVPCPDFPYWLSEDGAHYLAELTDDRQLPEHAKRLLCDAYMCMYQSPDVMMYR
ncbi:ubiquitin carboxyl-terminal hydrolase CYLD [Diprion similis]|uniref:ubiquitin carboxyl-terminal hydrolase CYLD n=1 Tax=Diprion similis TaxID=362088 RepID=UPI001EF8CD62|nr:ubiquitin carboxyl-terminal hydrolase CYLD [Diprion similis]